MSETFHKVAQIISESCDVERDDIRPDSLLKEELGLDSVDVYDISFAIEDAFDIELPVDSLAGDVASEEGSEGLPDLRVARLCEHIDALRAQASA